MRRVRTRKPNGNSRCRLNKPPAAGGQQPWGACDGWCLGRTGEKSGDHMCLRARHATAPQCRPLVQLRAAGSVLFGGKSLRVSSIKRSNGAVCARASAEARGVSAA
jgi:hypothetical protein